MEFIIIYDTWNVATWKSGLKLKLNGCITSIFEKVTSWIKATFELSQLRVRWDFEDNFEIIFLFLSEKHSCDPTLELSQWETKLAQQEGSDEGSRLKFLWRNVENCPYYPFILEQWFNCYKRKDGMKKDKRVCKNPFSRQLSGFGTRMNSLKKLKV